MLKLTGKELRQKYLDFFKSKAHAIVPSASLIPQNDPTVLFTTAGMHPLVPYLMGEKHPLGKRIANAQKCVRTSDIDDVGDNRHLTFFEMLGNWSLGDYFKAEAIEWSFEFLTEVLKIDPKNLYVTVFMGNNDSPIDQESIDVWKAQFAKVGIHAEVCSHNHKINGNKNYKIFPLPEKDNWWGPAGETGPCGPCSEMFVDTDPSKGHLQKTFDEEVDSFRIMEVWNDVFMEFNKVAPGKFEKLKQKNVDTGMGLERTICILNGKKIVFDTEFFKPLFDEIEKLSGKKYHSSDEVDRSMRIIADHTRTSTFILGDEKGISPSNVGQGYILRRLIRKMIRHGRLLGIEGFFTEKIANVVINEFAEIYPELKKNKKFIIDQLNAEEEKFSKTIEHGLKEFGKLSQSTKEISGKDAFLLFQSYGFPIEMTEELAHEKGIKVDKSGFTVEFEKHQELSRTSSAGMFKGGLADASDETKKLHTAAHLMLAALRKVLGEGVNQKGSNITPERLRFDFNFERKMTPEEIKHVEEIVNAEIKKSHPVICKEMTIDEAKKIGATGVFDHKYGEKVKVYSAGTFSVEICGGPHADNTAELGYFKIQKEEAVAAGVRRIKAVLTQN